MQSRLKIRLSGVDWVALTVGVYIVHVVASLVSVAPVVSAAVEEGGLEVNEQAESNELPETSTLDSAPELASANSIETTEIQ